MRTPTQASAAVAALAITALSLAGCPGSNSSPAGGSRAAAAITVSPERRKAQKIVKTCLAPRSWFSRAGRHAVRVCPLPGGHSHALEYCVQMAVLHNLSSRAGSENAAAVCLVADR